MPQSASDPPSGVRRRLLTLGGASVLSGLIAPRTGHTQTSTRRGVVRLRYAHSAPTTHGWHLWGVQFKTVVEAKSGGRIQVTVYPNAQMGTEQDIARQVRLGSLEMGAIGVALMNWVPQVSVTDAPFLFRTRQQCYNALDGALGDTLKRLALAQGFRIVGWNDLGSRSMTNSKHQISTAADMRDLKMRVPDSKSYIAMMQALGSTIVAIDLSELYLALSQHVADGQDTPPPVVQSLKLYEVQKFIAKTDHVLTNAYSVINPAVFDHLSANDQAAVTAAAQEATVWLRGTTQQQEHDAFAFLVNKGMQANLNVDTASFQQACSGVIPKFPDLFPPDLVKLARSAPT